MTILRGGSGLSTVEPTGSLIPSEELTQIRVLLEHLPSQPQDRLRSPYDALDINGFYDLIGAALRAQQLAEGKSIEELFFYTEEAPPENIDSFREPGTISFHLVRREPGVMGNTAPFVGSPKGYKPMVRQVYDDPQVPRYKIWELGQMFDNEIRFIMWSRTNKEGNTMALWFEDFMIQNMWLFRSRGVNQILYSNREADISIEDKRLVGRPLCYYVRTEKITQVREKVLEELCINISVSFYDTEQI